MNACARVLRRSTRTCVLVYTSTYMRVFSSKGSTRNMCTHTFVLIYMRVHIEVNSLVKALHSLCMQTWVLVYTNTYVYMLKWTHLSRLCKGVSPLCISFQSLTSPSVSCTDHDICVYVRVSGYARTCDYPTRIVLMRMCADVRIWVCACVNIYIHTHTHTHIYIYSKFTFDATWQGITSPSARWPCSSSSAHPKKNILRQSHMIWKKNILRQSHMIGILFARCTCACKLILCLSAWTRATPWLVASVPFCTTCMD